MDWRLSSDQAALVQEIDDFLDDTRRERDDDYCLEIAPVWSKRFSHRLAEKRWIALPWPSEYGGAAMSPVEQLLFNERMAYHRAPIGYHRRGVYYVGPALMRYGTDRQKQEYLSAITRAEISFCQGFSEPNAGSDLGAVQTRAVRSGDDYLIDGSKIWTTDAHDADYIWLLARTDPDAPKHRGLTIFVVPMRSEGIAVRPIIDMAGQHRFNEVHFDRVRVPASAVVGSANQGWTQAMTTLEFERSNITHFASIRRTLEEWRTLHAGHVLGGPVRGLFADAYIGMSVGYQLSWQVATAQERGCLDSRTASVVKLYGAELWQRVADLGLRLLGTSGAVRTLPGRGAEQDAAVTRYLTARSTTIAGGTSEVQRRVIAVRGIGMPD